MRRMLTTGDPMIQYTCEHCNEQLEAPDNLLGGELRCPKCQAVTLVCGIIALVHAVKLRQEG